MGCGTGMVERTDAGHRGNECSPRTARTPLALPHRPSPEVAGALLLYHVSSGCRPDYRRHGDV